jgi:hypothetical protein
MQVRLPFCRVPEPLAASLEAGRHIVDAISLAQATGGVLLGLLGLRFLPMLLLAAGWEVAEYLVKACAPLSFVASIQGALRPALGDVGMMMGGWLLGRVVRWARLRRQSRLGLDQDLLDAEPALSGEQALVPVRRRRRDDAPAPAFFRAPASAQSADFFAAADDEFVEVTTERSGVEPAGLHLELSDDEAEALRSALTARLAEMQREAERSVRQGFRYDLWETTGVLESLLARLPPPRRHSGSHRSAAS